MQLRVLYSGCFSSKETYNNSISQKKVKQRYISVGTVRVFIEPRVRFMYTSTHTLTHTHIHTHTVESTKGTG